MPWNQPCAGRLPLNAARAEHADLLAPEPAAHDAYRAADRRHRTWCLLLSEAEGGKPQASSLPPVRKSVLPWRRRNCSPPRQARARRVHASTNAFDAQDAAYKEKVLPKAVTGARRSRSRVSDGWYKYVGINGRIIGINTFGESARPVPCSSTSASRLRTSSRRRKRFFN